MVLTGCASTPRGAPGGTVGVAIAEFKYVPSDITVKAGTMVEWSNTDAAFHTVTTNDERVDSGALGSGKTFTHTFTEPGTFEYHCSVHPYMTGVVKVTAP